MLEINIINIIAIISLVVVGGKAIISLFKGNSIIQYFKVAVVIIALWQVISFILIYIKLAINELF